VTAVALLISWALYQVSRSTEVGKVAVTTAPGSHGLTKTLATKVDDVDEACVVHVKLGQLRSASENE
jgi:hypothetical protein